MPIPAIQDIALPTSAIPTKSVVTPLPAFLFLLSPTPRHPDVVFIGTAVAFHAVLEIANSFLDMLAPDFLGCVLVTAVAGIAAVVVTQVTRHAFHIVITIQNEILVVVEGRRYPLLQGMALAAIPGDLLM